MKRNKKADSKAGDWYKPRRRSGKKKKLLIVLLCIALAVAVVACNFADILQAVINTPFESYETDPETLALLAPVDEEAGNRIAEMPAYQENDTWAVYVYLVGSNLESMNQDELSSLTKLLIEDDVKAYAEQAEADNAEMLRTFVSEVTGRGVDLPQLLYRPDTSGYHAAEDEDGGESGDGTPIEDSKGYASSDLSDMMECRLSENVTVVVQTGGARRWQNSIVNPNRSQRFVISSEGTEEVVNQPLVNMADPDSLTDFLDFCTENYPADHTMLLMWNHGGGFTGYGCDEIYAMHSLSLAEIRSAIENAVGVDYDKPPFEVIAFDACLMASTEVAHSLRGLGRYLLASEEVEPASGFDYLTWLPALSENPGMNGAQLGRIVADSYVENCLGIMADLGYVLPSTFSVIDLAKADEVYEAYCDFASAALKKTNDDPAFLAELSRAAGNAITYASNSYRVYNTIDLGGFMSEIQPQIPEAEKVLSALGDAVLYTRSSSYLKDSKGLSIYFPARIEGIGGTLYCLKYINEVSESEDVNALYYYKIAGCLNEALDEYVTSNGLERLDPIDYSELADISDLELAVLGDGNLAMQLPEEFMYMLQSARMGIAKYDDESGDIEYYGEDAYAFMDEDGSVHTDFDGSWLFFGGNPLPLEVMSVNGEKVMFSTKILYNFNDATLITGYDTETDDVSVLGVRLDLDNSAVLDRSLIPLKDRDIIMIVYETGNLYSNAISDEVKPVIYKEGKTVLEEKSLADGDYYQYIIFGDLRSDTYYSGIINLSIKDGKVVSQELDPTVFGYDKD